MTDQSHTRANRRHVLQGMGVVAGAVAMPSIARAQNPIIMKIATPTINDNQHEWMRKFAALVEEGSKGAIKAELYPASQLGTAPRMIEGTQLGTIQALVMPPEFLSGVDSRYEVLGAPGLFKDLAHAHRAMNHPEFNSAFLSVGESKGIKGLGLFISAPMIVNCRTTYLDPPRITVIDPEAKALEGVSAPAQRQYHGAVVTNYRFSEGPLKGFSVGGAERWESRAAIGFFGKVGDPVGSPTVINVADPTRPVYDQGNFYTDLWMAYATRILKGRYGLKIQLNVTNVTEGGRLLPTAVNFDEIGRAHV